ncbi:organic cation transporter protein-like [Haemaphysalis longicornis]
MWPQVAEVLEARYRTLLNVGFCLGYGFASVCLPAVAYVLDNWKWLQVAAGISALAPLPLMMFIQESPRWLLTMNRDEAAKSAIQRIFAINRRALPNMDGTIAELMLRRQTSHASPWSGPLEILRYTRLRRSAVCAFIHWFCDCFLLYVVSLSSADLGGSGSYIVKFALSSAVELPGACLAFAIVYFFRRKTSQISFTLMAAAFAAASCSVPLNIAYLNLALNMGSRCMLNVTTAIKWVHTMEVFPTRVRNFGFAACFTFGRVGGILAPFTRDLMIHAHWTLVPSLLLVAGGISAAAVALLPETYGLDLPDTFAQADDLGSRHPRSSRRPFQKLLSLTCCRNRRRKHATSGKPSKEHQRNGDELQIL